MAPDEEAVVTVGSVRDKIELPAGRRMRWGGCGVVSTATAAPVIPCGQIWPSPAHGACTSGTTPGRGGRAGMVLLVMIFVVSAMVVREIWWVSGWERCRVYINYGNEFVGIKVVKLWKNDLTKLLN